MSGIDTSIALISLADAKEQLKITTETEDTLVGNFVNMVSRMVNKYVGRDLLSATHTEYYNGNGESEIAVRHCPIISLTSLHNSNNSRTFDSTTELDVSSDVFIDKPNGIIKLEQGSAGSATFTKGTGNIKIVYVGGYTLATVPNDIQYAVRVWVGTIYMKYYNRRYEYISSNAGQQSTTFIEQEMPKDVRMILDTYKDIFGYPSLSHAD